MAFSHRPVQQPQETRHFPPVTVVIGGKLNRYSLPSSELLREPDGIFTQAGDAFDYFAVPVAIVGAGAAATETALKIRLSSIPSTSPSDSAPICQAPTP